MMRAAAHALLVCCMLSAAAAVSDPLRAEVQDLRRLVSVMLGAEPLSEAQGFLPGTSNTQRLIARQPQLWPQHFTFLSVVAADSRVACSHVMTDRAKLAGGPLYLVLADDAGRLYFFSQQGHLLHEHNTGVTSGITALSSELVRHNQTQLLVGQHDGTITVLVVTHEHPRLPDGSGIQAVHPLVVSTAADRAQQRNHTDVSSHQQPIRHIMFAMSSTRRMLLAVDEAGHVLLMAASSGHILMVQHVTAGRPLAVNMNSNFQLVVQTEAATAIMLMKRGRSLVTKHCAGLAGPQQPAAGHEHAHEHGQPGSSGDGDRLVTAVFDPKRPFRAFGVTAGGELLVLVVPSGVAAHACRVLQRVPLGLPPGPVQLVMGSGRLVLLHPDGIAAFNLSAHKVQLPGSYLVSHTWAQLWWLYGLTQQHAQLLQPADAAEDAAAAAAPHSSSSVGAEGVLHALAWDTPLMAAAAAQGLLLVPFGNSGLATFASGPAGVGLSAGSAVAGGGAVGGDGSSGGGGAGADVNWVKMLQPFVLIMMILVGVWQFVRASNRTNLSARRAARYGAGGLSGLDEMGDLMSRSQGLAASYMMQGELTGQRRPGGWGLGEDEDEGLGSFSRLDRDFGPYAGPRGRREPEPSFAPLGALSARRRARAAMFSGRQAEREQGLRRRGGTAAAAAGTQAAARRQGGMGQHLAGVGSCRGVLSESIAEQQEEEDEGEEAQEQEYDAEDIAGFLQQQQQQQQQQQPADLQDSGSTDLASEEDAWVPGVVEGVQPTSQPQQQDDESGPGLQAMPAAVAGGVPATAEEVGHEAGPTRSAAA